MAADAYGSAVDVVEAHEQLDHRRLARAGRADERDRLAFPHLGGEVVDDRLALLVAERHVVELDVAGDVGGRDARLLDLHLGRIQELEDALGGRGHLLQDVGDLRKLGDRLREVLDVLDERLDVADGDDALHGEEAAQDRDGDVAGVADEVHDRLHEAREELRLPCALEQAVVGLGELADHTLLLAERLHDRMAGEGLLDLAVDEAERFLLLAEVALGARHDDPAPRPPPPG